MHFAICTLCAYLGDCDRSMPIGGNCAMFRKAPAEVVLSPTRPASTSNRYGIREEARSDNWH